MAIIPDALLAPISGEGVVGVAWTLRQEIVFYAVFGIAILAPRVGIGLFVLWQSASFAEVFFHPQAAPGLVKPFAYIFNLGFLVGVAVAWLADRIKIARPGWLILAGGAAFIALMVAETLMFARASIHVVAWTTPASPLFYSLAAGVMLLGMALWERRASLPASNGLLVLGGASYLLYLIHGPVGSVLIRLFSARAFAFCPTRRSSSSCWPARAQRLSSPIYSSKSRC